jgi:hypothetical protein
MASFGPGKAGCFGEGGNGASVAGPLALPAGQVPTPNLVEPLRPTSACSLSRCWKQGCVGKPFVVRPGLCQCRFRIGI